MRSGGAENEREDDEGVCAGCAGLDGLGQAGGAFEVSAAYATPGGIADTECLLGGGGEALRQGDSRSLAARKSPNRLQERVGRADQGSVRESCA